MIVEETGILRYVANDILPASDKTLGPPHTAW